ncbi:general stress protein [Pantoea sp. Aalb]|uniref:general stress protein n=1 Tax=Pantoea sp. Aalb TaxID=2576762 RepID=UPI001323E791|nr:general stress protein [Pantoea sp. Aalb]MXP67714.1 stress-induced protein [Pantoea sp. Aalb]
MNKLKGGRGNFAMDHERAREAGKKGGTVSSGNFKNNPERAVKAGRKGGKKNRRTSDYNVAN